MIASFRLFRAAWIAAFALAAAVVVMPATAHSADFLVGMQDSSQTLVPGSVQNAGLGEMQGLGVKVVRVTFSWREIAHNCKGQSVAALSNDTNPCYDWSLYDGLVNSATARGMQVLASVFKSPDWANGVVGRPYFTGGSWSAFLRWEAYYRAFVQAAAKRYRVGSPAGFIRYWTIWNEPNSRTFWAPFTWDAPKRYAYMYAKSSQQIKRLNRFAKVAPGPTGPNATGMKPITYIQRMQPFLSRYGAKIDAWAHNPYSGAPINPRRPVFRSPAVGIGNITDLFRTLDRHRSTRGRAVWATEFAYQTPPERTFETSFSNQSIWMAEAMDMAWRTRRIPIFVWYIMKDPKSRFDWQSGVIKSSGQRKPSYAMYQRSISVLSDNVRRTQPVYLWGRSGVHPGTAQLVQSRNRRTWTRVTGQRSARGGVRYATKRLAVGTWYFATRDNLGRGPARKVIVRR